MMLVSVSVSAGFYTTLSWAVMVVKESWSLVDFYTGIRDGSVEVPSSSSRRFVFPETFREQPLSVSAGSKHCGPFHACSVSATLGKMAPFRTYIKYAVEQPSHSKTASQCGFL